MVIQRAVLGTDPDDSPDLFRVFCDLILPNKGRARCRTEQSSKDADKSTFSCPIGSEQTEDLPAFHIERHIVNCDYCPLFVPEGFGEMLDAYDAMLMSTMAPAFGVPRCIFFPSGPFSGSAHRIH